MNSHEFTQVRGACRALGQMRRDETVHGRSVEPGEIALEQTVVLEVMRATDHGFPPSRPRNLRAARNRWTRTVDSFNPVTALTSRGVQSP